MRGLVLWLVLLAPLPLRADALSDLRSVLRRFPARGAFSAEATVEASGRSQSVAASRTGKSHFEVEAGASGLTIRVGPPELAEARNEAEGKKRDPDAPTPARTAMVALTIFDVIDALDSAAMLLDDLDGATLIGQTASAYGGKPATLLNVKVKATLAGTRSRIVREPVIELRIWLDANGIPVAAQRESTYSASIVIASAANVRSERWEFAVAGDRLYAARNEQEDRATAVGRSVVSSRTVTYVPR